jgi:hypothetical protein
MSESSDLQSGTGAKVSQAAGPRPRNRLAVIGFAFSLLYCFGAATYYTIASFEGSMHRAGSGWLADKVYDIALVTTAYSGLAAVALCVIANRRSPNRLAKSGVLLVYAIPLALLLIYIWQKLVGR